jgi:hypothetical protein
MRRALFTTMYGNCYWVCADWEQASDPVTGLSGGYIVSSFNHRARGALQACLERAVLDVGSDPASYKDDVASALENAREADETGNTLKDNADTSHASVSDLYHSRRWGLQTEHHGELPLQVVSLRDAQASDTHVVSKLRFVYPDLMEDEALQLIERAGKVRQWAEDVESLLEAAVRAYEYEDLQECLTKLATAERTRFGGFPAQAVSELRARLIIQVRLA